MFRRLQRLLGSSDTGESRPPNVASDATKVKSCIFDRSTNIVAVVGESFRQDALDRLAGGRDTEGVVQKEHVAGLMPEPSNPVDAEAVEVQIDGWRVGYLGRADARAYRPVLDRVLGIGLMPGAHATLTGGWDRGGGDTGSIGVELLVGTPAQLWAELDSAFGAELMPASIQAAEAAAEPVSVVVDWDGDCVGKMVCFSGESGFQFQGQQITRGMQEVLAAQHGLTVHPRITKKVDILVIGLGHPRTGKVKKAEEYGTLILEESVFWSKLGVKLDA